MKFKHYLKYPLFITFIFFTSLLSASLNVYQFENKLQQKRFESLITELRCPKCQNNDLADSNAPLAKDIKNYIYNGIIEGRSDNEIRDFLISSYGEFITYKPLFKGYNILVWTLPFIIALFAVFFIIIAKSRQQKDKPNIQKSMAQIIKEHEQKQGGEN